MDGRELVAAHFDNRLTDEQAVELAAWIKASPQNAEFFAGWSVLEGHISERYGVAELLKAEKQISNQAVADIRGPGVLRGRPLRIGLLAAAAVVLIAGVVVVISTAPEPQPGRPVAQRPVPDTGPPTPGPYVFATVSGQRNAVWADASSGARTAPEIGGPILAGPNRLVEGVAHLRTADGVDLMIEGPANFTFEDASTLRLDTGRVYGDASASTELFHIRSERVGLNHCDQVFAMRVGEDATALCQVYSGTADVSAYDESGQAEHVSRLMPNQSLTLTAQGQIHLGRLDDAAFVRTLTPSALEVGRDYVEAVRASGPTDYWRFEQFEGGDLYNDISGRPALRVQMGGKGLVPSGDSQNRHLHRTALTGEYLVSTEKLAINSGLYSIECWVRNDHAERWATLFALQVFPERREELEFGLIQLEMMPTVEGDAAAGHRFMLTHANQAGRFEYDFLSMPDVDASSWHHIVVTCEGPSITLFRDGQPWLTANARNAAMSGEAAFVVGRNGITAGGNSRLFDGSLDEVALYDRALTLDEVRKHYHAMDRLPGEGGDLQ